MKKMLIATTAVLMIGSSFAFATENENQASATTPADQMASFEACMAEAGFQKDQDFQTRLMHKSVAGENAVVGFQARVRAYVTSNGSLLAKANHCAQASGHSKFS